MTTASISTSWFSVLCVSLSEAPSTRTSPLVWRTASTRNDGPPATVDGVVRKTSDGLPAVAAEKPVKCAGNFGEYAFPPCWCSANGPRTTSPSALRTSKNAPGAWVWTTGGGWRLPFGSVPPAAAWPPSPLCPPTGWRPMPRGNDAADCWSAWSVRL